MVSVSGPHSMSISSARAFICKVPLPPLFEEEEEGAKRKKAESASSVSGVFSCSTSNWLQNWLPI